MNKPSIIVNAIKPSTSISLETREPYNKIAPHTPIINTACSAPSIASSYDFPKRLNTRPIVNKNAIKLPVNVINPTKSISLDAIEPAIRIAPAIPIISTASLAPSIASLYDSPNVSNTLPKAAKNIPNSNPNNASNAKSIDLATNPPIIRIAAAFTTTNMAPSAPSNVSLYADENILNTVDIPNKNKVNAPVKISIESGLMYWAI